MINLSAFKQIFSPLVFLSFSKPMPDTKTEAKTLSFEEMFNKEVTVHSPECKKSKASQSGSIEQSCTCPKLNPARLTGLAFSGGGIRSATFNLGIIQSLAKNDLLGKFDYLSTVSGGGYIGSWLSAQIHRQTGAIEPKVESFQTSLKTSLESGTELDSIKWLRRYSNYLTPKKGLSGDTLAAVGTWLRNTLLNQTALCLVFISLLLLLQLVPRILHAPGWLEPTSSEFWLLISIISILLTIVSCVLSLPKLRCCDPVINQVQSITKPLEGLIVFLALFAAYNLSLWMYSTSTWNGMWIDNGQSQSIDNLLQLVKDYKLLGTEDDMTLLTAIQASYFSTRLTAIAWAGIYALPWLISMVYSGRPPAMKHCTKPEDQHPTSRLRYAIVSILSTLSAGAFGGYLIYLLIQVVAQQDMSIRIWWATGFGTPLLLAIFCTTITLHQGLMGRLFRVSQMEWWSRIGGYVLLVALSWAGMHVLLIYVPPLIDWLDYKFIAAGGLVWAAHSFSGVILGKSADSGGLWKERITRAAPYVFVLGYLVAVSWIVHALLYKFGTPLSKDIGTPDSLNLNVPEVHPPVPFSSFLEHALQIDNNADTRLLGLILATCALASIILIRRLDVNLFSIHHFYRNRLARCYLGAGRGTLRVPNLFTGFDPCDDIRLAELDQRPLHLVNTALNLVHGNNLAWQDRKAYSFTFSHIACGFAYPQNSSQEDEGFYDAAQYMGGVHLGTALAASGAAASPNMGYHSSPAVAFLLTIFNVRLGHWCPNTKSGVIDPANIKRESPKYGGEYLFKELLGMTDDKKDFVYLSDGGHFENLGVYELVRRGCRHIMVVDAGQDEMRTFNDLANMIRKCYIDFGVTIEIGLDALRRNKKGISQSCFELGEIIYPDRDYRGVLLYIKPSLLRDIPEDVRQYATANKTFPHQSTADQFFDEEQFESYRHLGEFLMNKVLEELIPTTGGKIQDAGTLSRRWGLFRS